MHTEQRAEVIELARRALTDPKIARGAFRKLAVAAGYKGAVGGWIYYTNGHHHWVVTQGWQALANLVVIGRVRFEQ